MAITEASLQQAQRRMRDRIAGSARVASARYDKRAARVVVEFDNGAALAFPPALAQGLAGATARELASIEVTPTGLGLHFPELDADLYVPALLEGTLGSRRWMAQSLGRAGGCVSSPAKARAARGNGALGGRPRKTGAS